MNNSNLIRGDIAAVFNKHLKSFYLYIQYLKIFPEIISLLQTAQQSQDFQKYFTAKITEKNKKINNNGDEGSEKVSIEKGLEWYGQLPLRRLPFYLNALVCMQEFVESFLMLHPHSPIPPVAPPPAVANNPNNPEQPHLSDLSQYHESSENNPSNPSNPSNLHRPKKEFPEPVISFFNKQRKETGYQFGDDNIPTLLNNNNLEGNKKSFEKKREHVNENVESDDDADELGPMGSPANSYNSSKSFKFNRTNGGKKNFESLSRSRHNSDNHSDLELYPTITVRSARDPSSNPSNPSDPSSPGGPDVANRTRQAGSEHAHQNSYNNPYHNANIHVVHEQNQQNQQNSPSPIVSPASAEARAFLTKTVLGLSLSFCFCFFSLFLSLAR